MIDNKISGVALIIVDIEMMSYLAWRI